MSGSQPFARPQFDIGGTRHDLRRTNPQPDDTRYPDDDGQSVNKKDIRMPDSKSNNKRRSGFLTSPVAWMRLSSLLFVFLMFGHMSAYPWSSARSVEETHLVGSMKSIEFIFMGERSTYWSLYFGWGLLVGVLLFAMASMLWLLSDLAPLAPRRLGLIAGIISAVCGIGSYLSFRYFYVPPFLCFTANCVILLTVAVQLLRGPARFTLGEPAKT